jgi:hypothetical protein
MQRKSENITSTTEIYKTLSIQKNTFNTSPSLDANNLLKIIILLSFLNSVEAQEDANKEIGIAIGCIITLGLALILCALTKARLFDCCTSSNSLSNSINYENSNSDLEEAQENTQSTYTLPVVYNLK